MSALAALRAALELPAQPICLQLTPFEILDAEEDSGLVRVAFAPQPAFGNHFGNIQGGFAAAMLDVPISFSVYVRTGRFLPTVEIKCSYLRPARIGRCIGEAQILRAGKNLVFVEGRLLGPDGELAVHATATVLAAVSGSAPVPGGISV